MSGRIRLVDAPIRRRRWSQEGGLLETYPRAATFSCKSIRCICHWIEGFDDHTDGTSASSVPVAARLKARKRAGTELRSKPVASSGSRFHLFISDDSITALRNRAARAMGYQGEAGANRDRHRGTAWDIKRSTGPARRRYSLNIPSRDPKILPCESRSCHCVSPRRPSGPEPSPQGVDSQL